MVRGRHYPWRAKCGRRYLDRRTIVPHAVPEPFVQAAILRALRELRLPDAFDAAMRALSHPLAAVRLEAVGVVGCA